MKLVNCLTLSLTAASLVCVAPHFCAAQNVPQATASANSNANCNAQQASTAGTNEAAQMVPAEAELTRTLDARQDQSGSAFQAKLDGTVHLKDGIELPHGTVLEGKVTADQMRSDGTSRLALQFTEAKLKDGKTIPIEATIVGINGPLESDDTNASLDGPVMWNGTSLIYDDLGVMSHVDLHSRIGSSNSGTLVATGKSDMRLRMGSRMSLALGEKNPD